jgi:hypothetical protein
MWRVLLRDRLRRQLDNQLGWLNYSKWAEAFDPPAPGPAVAVRLDAKGFVRNVTLLAHAPDAPTSAVASRERAIVRLAVPKKARKPLRRSAPRGRASRVVLC